MPHINATIVLNLHKEGIFLKRTLISLDQAVQFARKSNENIELIVVLDRADEITRQITNEHDYSIYNSLKIIEVDNGSLGLSRNDGIALATGEYIFTADGDDLISENFILDTLLTARHGSKRCLYFPEYLMAFGANYHIAVYRPLNEVTPLAFIDTHPYISRVCAHRSVFKIIKYDDLRLTKGYAFEDWHFNATAVANNIDIKIVPDTIIFYRQRANSLLQQANALSARQIAPTTLFDPTIWQETNREYIKNIDVQNTYKRSKPADRAFLEKDNIKYWVNKANTTESLININLYNNCAIFTNAQSSLECGHSYYTICELLSQYTFDHVFLFPYISKGGAEKYILEVMQSLYRQSPHSNNLIITGEDFYGTTWHHKLPANAIAINLQYMGEKLSDESRQVITIKLIETVAKKATIHIRQSVYGDTFLRKYGNLFSTQNITYYRFSDVFSIKNDELSIIHSPINLISETIDSLSNIITDNEYITINDKKILGAHQSKWKTLLAPIKVHDQARDKSHIELKKILWASRVDIQKRPSVVSLIAKILNKVDPEINISAYGSSVFEDGIDQYFNSKTPSNLTYYGGYDGLLSIKPENYGIFIYTSLFDGTPNVLLEAMATGLIVIAPDVGGISGIVKNGETGILLPSINDDYKMAKAYAEAIMSLHKNPTTAIKLSRNARTLLENNHSYNAFDKSVADIFNIRT